MGKASVTPSAKRESGKQRRLVRELSDKQYRETIIHEVAGFFRDFTRTAVNNPVIGLGLGISVVDILFRARVLSYTAAAAFYGFTGASVAADIVGKLEGILPFSHGSASTNAIQPAATTLAIGEEKDKTVVYNKPIQQGVG